MRKATLKYKNLFSLTSKILGSYNLCGFLPYKPILAINRDPKFWTCRISITKNKKENRKHSLRDFKLVIYSKTKHFRKNMWPSSWMVCLTGLLNDTNSLHDQSFNNCCLGSVSIMLLWRIPVIEYTCMVYYHNHFAFFLLRWFPGFALRISYCA